MAQVFPFHALRPTAALASRVAELPYDVMNTEEAIEIARDNKYSFLRVDKPEITLPPGTDHYAPEVYLKAKENLESLIHNGVLARDVHPSFYLYRLTMGEVSQTGLVCCVLASDYLEGEIKKHEHTRADKEADRVRHVTALSAHTGPIFLSYRESPVIDAFVESYTGRVAPVYEFVSEDRVSHTVWAVDDARSCDDIRSLFAPVICQYIADGHHRAAAAVAVAKTRPSDTEAQKFLAVCFPHNQLNIMDYNRVVKTLNGLSREAFLECAAHSFDIQPVEGRFKPSRRHNFGMYMNCDNVGQWYKLSARDIDESDPVASLDVSVLQDCLLGPVLGIKDPRVSADIDFIGGIRGIGELERRVDSGEWAVAFALFPTSMGELMSVADAGDTMPPKSTWFEPKLRSGLFIHTF